MKLKAPTLIKTTLFISVVTAVSLFSNNLFFEKYDNVPEEKIHFELEDINGTVWESKDLEGSIVVFNFWFTACPPCKKEIPELNKLVEKYKNKGVVFIGVSLDDTDKIDDFTDMYPFKYNLIPNGAYFIDANHVSSFPTQFIINKNGSLIKRIIGSVTFKEMDKQLNTILPISNI